MNKKQVLAFSNSIFFLIILVGVAMLCIPQKALGQSQTLSSGSTFTTPHKITSLTVQVWGAGGGGGSGNKGGGGGGGAFASITFSGSCIVYTSDAADDAVLLDLRVRRPITQTNTPCNLL